MIKAKKFRLIISLVTVALAGYLLGANQGTWQSVWQTSQTRGAIVSSSLAVKAKDLKDLLKNEAPQADTRGLFSPLLRREQNPSEAENSSHSSPDSRPRFSAKGDKNFTLINVQKPYQGEIEKTDVFVDTLDLPNSSSLLPFDKTTAIIVYDQDGKTSLKAVAALKDAGYINVKYLDGGMQAWQKTGGKIMDLSKLEQDVIPETGAELPVVWGDLGPRLISLGVIDADKFRQATRPTSDQEEILTKGTDKKIKIDRNNVQFVVDMLWALGLAQKSLVYDEGPMGTQYQKEAGNFASTGGWTLARGKAMQYYNQYRLVPLTPTQQKQVAEISKNVYRPCCGNSTYFPDCNHGMAALAIIELMVSSGSDEPTIYKKLLEFNSYWFVDTYLTTATYFARQKTAWKDVDPKQIMGPEFSSGQGAADIAKKVGPLPWRAKSAGSCGA